MKKLNLKVGIAAFSVMLIGLVTAAVMTFNFADSENPLNLATVSDAVYADSVPTTTTMIDRIIENSLASDSEDKNYHIVEISSGSSSNFVNFMTDSGFRELIFNQHSTTGKKFATDARITYDYYTASTVTAADVQGADLIYISEDPNKKYSKSNDIPTDLVSVLSNFAVGDYKPLIIDTTGGKGSSDDESTINYATLYRNVLKNKRRYSLEYPHAKTPLEYITNSTTSLWLPIHGKDTSKNWGKTDDGKKVASIITFTDSSTYFAGFLQGSATGQDLNVDGTTQTVYAFADLPTEVQLYLYVSSETKPDYVRFDSKASNAVVTEAELAKYDLVLFDNSCKNKPINKDTYLAIRSYELSKGHIVYDTELIVDSSSSTSISTDINTDAQNYKTILSKVSQAGKPSYSNIFVTNRSDFNTLITNVIPDAYDNNIVYIINNGSFRGLGGTGDASNKFTLLEIEPAYPINTVLANHIQTSGHSGDASIYNYIGTKTQYYYTKGWYYLNTMNVLNGATADEISFDSGKSPLSMYDETSTATIQVPYEYELPTTHMELVRQPNQNWPAGSELYIPTGVNHYNDTQIGTYEGGIIVRINGGGAWIDGACLYQQVHDTEIRYRDEVVQGLAAAGTKIQDYYAWKWSRAKLAYVTGKSYDEVEVVHMSSAEFNASLDSLNDTYDIIYIGGDNSAVKPVYYWFKNSGNGNLVHEIYGGIGGYRTYAAFFKDFPAYNMYFTVGDTYKTSYNFADNAGTTIQTGSVAASSGNDLTNNRYKDLKDFADAGRPVIIGKDLYEAVTFDLSKSVNLQANETSMAQLDNKIDPESNMYKLVSSWISSSKTNIVKNFDFDDTYRADNSGKDYGNTIGDFVTVFRKTVTGDGTTDCNADGIEDTSESLVRDYNGVRIKNYSVKTTHNGVDCTNGNDVYKTFMSSSQRPKYIVESAPVLYSTGEFLPTHTLKFKVKLSESSPDSKARIYIDDNGDGKFTSDEKISSDVALTKGQSVTVSANLKADFSGPVFWKLEVFNKNNEKDSASVTGVSAVKTSKKQPIDILQILPTEAKGHASKAADAHIFLCKDCQESLQILTGGRLMGTGSGYTHVKFHDDLAREFIYNQQQSTDDATYGNPGFTGSYQTPTVVEPTAEEDYGFNFDAYMTSHNGHGNSTYKQVGVHEHKFGFAAIQDQAVNGHDYYIDDFNLNLFDNASDMYDIRLTILTIQELNELANNIPTYINKASIDDYQNLSDKYYRYFTALSDILDGEDASKYSTTVSEFLGSGMYDNFEPTLKNAATIKAARDKLKSDTEALAADYTNGVKYFTNDKGSPTQAEYKEIIDNIVKHETYEDLYFYNVGYSSNKVGTYKNINENFVVWRNAKVLEQYFYQKHIYYQILASGGKLRETITPANADSGNRGAFGLVVLGAAEHFAKSGDEINQNATKMIVDYASKSSSSAVDEPGDILLFHNTLTNNNAGTYFSNAMRPLVGMDTSAERISNSTRISNASSKLNIAKVELTDTYGYTPETSNQGSAPYKYATVVFNRNSGPEGVDVSNPNFDAFQFYGRTGSPDIMTDYAQCSSTTKGIMTSFPNAISNKIKISGTHQQTYTLNIPDENLTVWYSLAGGTNGTDSSVLVSDLNDHANNYYLYTYNNVTFFGAGHMYHTGLNRLNSEESKLIINAILNSSRPSAMSDDTKLELVTHKNKNYPLTPVSDESTEYKMYQYETTYSPDKLVDFEFGIDASSDKSKGITIKYLDIFFDLDYDPAVAYDHTYNRDKDISVYGNEFDQNGNRRTDVTTPFNVKGKTQNLVHTSGDGQYLDANGNLHNFIDEILNSTDDILYIDSTAFNGIFKNLTLRDEYFVYGSGDYTYLSVVITDSKGNQVTKTIKIKKAPFLFDIT